MRVQLVIQEEIVGIKKELCKVEEIVALVRIRDVQYFEG